MPQAVGDVATTYCECTASYSTKRDKHIVVVDNPDCPIHHP